MNKAAKTNLMTPECFMASSFLLGSVDSRQKSFVAMETKSL
jgi:hypothetical protein